MIKLNLETKTKEHELIKAYLEENASDILAEKINNGVKIEKDGKTLINKKTLESFMSFARDEAKKQAEKGANCAMVQDDVVFGWAVHYFEEESIEGTLFNEDGTPYNKPIPKTENKPVEKPVKAEKPKQDKKSKNTDSQISMFDFSNDDYYKTENYYDVIEEEIEETKSENDIVEEETIEDEIVDDFNPLKEYSSTEFIEDKDGTQLHLGFKDNKLFAGPMFNIGIMNKYEIEYDRDISLTDNIEKLYYVIFDENNVKAIETKEEPKKELSIYDKYEMVKEKYSDFHILLKLGDFYEAYDEDAEKISFYLETSLVERTFKDKKHKMIGLPINKHIDSNILVLTFYNTIGIIENNILTIHPKFDTNENEYKLDIITGEILK